MSAAYLLTPYLAGDIYLLSTHLSYWLTPKKIIAAVVLAVIVVVAVVWFIRRRQNRARSRA